MNIRAIFLGTVIGFIIAVVPSCSGTKCAASNCAGCCDAKGQCVKSPSNSNNTTCGTQGNACADCTKLATPTTCNTSTFTCGSGSGGGTGGSGGSCDGCKLPSSGNCVSLANTSVVNCGIAGATCAACNSGQQCVNGACQTPDAGTPVGGVGDKCTSDSQCNRVPGGKGFCKKTMVPAGTVYQDGYCSKRCTAQADCGSGNYCAYWMGPVGELENICYKGCDPNVTGACRTGYDCTDISLSSTVRNSCFPTAAAAFDAGPGNDGPAGGPCVDDTACGPAPYFNCIPEATDAGPTGFTGGSCSGDCSMTLSDTWCGDAGICLPYVVAQDSRGSLVSWLCGQSCTPGGANNGGCRTNYVCEEFGQAGSGFGSCTPDCRTAPTGFCSNSCDTATGLCQ